MRGTLLVLCILALDSTADALKLLSAARRARLLVACESEPKRRPMVESAASRKADLMKASERAYNEEEEKALRICRIEFAPYPAGKYNKIASEEEGLGKAAAFDQCRKDLPALASWSDLEIESTFTALKVRQYPPRWPYAYPATLAHLYRVNVWSANRLSCLMIITLGSARSLHRRRPRNF